MRHIVAPCLSALVLLPASAVTQTSPPPGQALSLVADIHTEATPISSEIDGAKGGYNADELQSFVQVGGYWYFVAHTNATGAELHRTDGTPGGTALVKDIAPGPFSSEIRYLTAHAGKVYFVADDSVHGEELWASDGTPGGTHLVRDIRPGAAGSDAGGITSWNGGLTFRADDGTHGVEPWTSDGTTLGTTLLADINPGAANSYPAYMHPAPGGTALLFEAATAAEGYELWTTDGTTAGTQLLLEINPGPDSGGAAELTTWNGLVYFSATDGVHGDELWVTDGTAGGTSMVADMRPGPNGSSIDFAHSAEFDGELYFSAKTSGGREPHKTDGTAQGTVLVQNYGENQKPSNPTDFIEFDGALYFLASDEDVVGRELVKLDAGGSIVPVSNFLPGAVDSFHHNGLRRNLIEFDGKLVFGALTPQGFEVGVSDGTPAGTQLLADIAPGADGSEPAWFTPIGPDALLFAAENDALGRELWVTDGTTAGTQLFAEVDAGSTTADSFPSGFVSVGDDMLFFTATDADHGKEPWVWNAGTGAALLRDVQPGPVSSMSLLGADFTGALIDGAFGVYFAAGGGLWVTDGTAAGTQLVKDFAAGSSGSFNPRITSFENRLYLAVEDGVHGVELWVSDGTEAGTVMLRDINPGAPSSSPRNFVAMNGKLYFTADNGWKGEELWVTDGTAPGTQLVADINPGSLPSTPHDLVVFRDHLVFTATTASVGQRVWISDGTTSGTTMLTGAVTPELYLSFKPLYTPAGDLLFFRATSASGRELWVTDLTPAGTQMVADISVESAGSPTPLGAANGRLFFSVDDGVHGRELWSSDGTSAGTAMVIDLDPSGSSSPFQFQRVGNGFYFAATTPTHGRELFYSDGTAAGTVLAAEITPGAVGSDPQDLALADGRLFFQAVHPVFGRELHALDPAGATSQSIGQSNGGALLSTNDPVLGAPFTVSLDDVPLSPVANALAWSFPVSTPTGLGADPSNELWLGALQILALLPPGDYDIGGTLPADPLLEGVQITLQNIALKPLTTSNAVSLVFHS